MRTMWIVVVCFIAVALWTGCRKCYVCSAQTEFGPVEREVCGRGEAKTYVQHLTTYKDSTGVGPWQCDKK